jgi:hypothetical protein
MRRDRSGDEYRVTGVADRLDVYETAGAPEVATDDTAEEELVERAATLLSVMPRNQLRATIESLLSPNDLERGRRAIDALIDRAFAAEDETGHLRRTA